MTTLRSMPRSVSARTESVSARSRTSASDRTHDQAHPPLIGAQAEGVPPCPSLPLRIRGWVCSSSHGVSPRGVRWSFTTVTPCVPCSRTVQPGTSARVAGAGRSYPARAGWEGGSHWRRTCLGVGTGTINPTPRNPAPPGSRVGRRRGGATRRRDWGSRGKGTAATSRTDHEATGAPSLGVTTHCSTLGARRLQTPSTGGDGGSRGASLGSDTGPSRPGISGQSPRSILICARRSDSYSVRCRRVRATSKAGYATLPNVSSASTAIIYT